MSTTIPWGQAELVRFVRLVPNKQSKLYNGCDTSLHRGDQNAIYSSGTIGLHMTDEGIIAARETVIESMERSAEVYGLSRSAGRVYGVLYFADAPLSISELVDRTGYAKSTISNVTRRLERLSIIRRRSSRGGGRRVQFEAEADVWFILQDVLRQHLQREMQATIRTLDRAEGELDELDETEATRRHIEKMQEIRHTYEELQELTELAARYSASEIIEAITQYADRRDGH